jgi:hypothetical protein
MTINKLKDNVQEFVRLLGGKLEAFQSQWDDAKPSDLVRFEKGFISPDNKTAYENIVGSPLNITDLQKGGTAAPQTSSKAQVTQGQPQAGVTIQTPQGPMWFANQQQADAFKKEAGIR